MPNPVRPARTYRRDLRRDRLRPERCGATEIRARNASRRVAVTVRG